MTKHKSVGWQVIVLLCALACTGNTWGGSLVVDDVTAYGTVLSTQNVEHGSVPTNGLVLWYGFDANTGSSVVDKSGCGHSGTVYGATWQDVGKIGGAFYFRGKASGNYNADYIDTDLDLMATGTVALWFRLANPLNYGYPPLMAAQVYGDAYNNFEIRYMSAAATRNKENLEVWGINGTTESLATTTGVSLATWHHLVMTTSNGTTKIYLNGVLEDTYVGNALTDTHDYLIGTRDTLRNYPFHGHIDEVLIYNRVLTSTEIADLCDYNGTNLPTAYAEFHAGAWYSKPLGDVGMGIYTNNP